MLLVTPENTRWRRWFYSLCALWIGLHFAFAPADYAFGGSSLGLAYGTLGLATIVILMYFGVRKRSYKSSWGTVEGWLHAHVYLGLLVLLAILLHSGFRFHNPVAVAALALLFLVALSGVWGAVLYTVVPLKMASVDSHLTIVEISGQINQIAHSMARLTTGKSEEFQRLCAGFFEAERPGPMAGWRSLFGRYAKRRREHDLPGSFEDYLGRVPAKEQSDLSQLLVLARQRHELHDRLIRRQRYTNLMSAWLYIHVPLSFALVVAVAAHVMAFFYYG